MVQECRKFVGVEECSHFELLLKHLTNLVHKTEADFVELDSGFEDSPILHQDLTLLGMNLGAISFFPHLIDYHLWILEFGPHNFLDWVEKVQENPV